MVVAVAVAATSIAASATSAAASEASDAASSHCLHQATATTTAGTAHWAPATHLALIAKNATCPAPTCFVDRAKTATSNLPVSMTCFAIRKHRHLRPQRHHLSLR